MTARTVIVALLMVTAALAALVPTATAQGAQQINVQLSCGSGPESIRPLGTPGQWSCQADPQTSSGGVSDPASFVTVQLQSPDAPSWANVIIAPASLTFQYGAEGEGYPSKDFQVSVALTQNAPAFQAQRITLDGSSQALGQGSTRETSVLPTQITVTPGYFNLYNVRLTKKIGQGGPQESVVYPLQIDNFSNGETRFEFALTTPDNVPQGFQPVIPEPTVLQSQATGGETTSGQVQFSVYTPYQNGYVNEVGAIQLSITSAYAPNTNVEGTSSTVSTLTQARGFYVPGPGAGIAAIAMLGVALAMSRYVRED